MNFNSKCPYCNVVWFNVLLSYDSERERFLKYAIPSTGVTNEGIRKGNRLAYKLHVKLRHRFEVALLE